ncbi:sensor histidine kinase [Coralloluteibacterium thermophilus]|uniref:histidine kinase n=1 Tax=Coralloluteibacterium thermophilum TaxID=2707049 RepID=A0ABV9NF98_9GAMM
MNPHPTAPETGQAASASGPRRASTKAPRPFRAEAPADVLEARHAPMLKVVLILSGLAQPLTLAYGLLAPTGPSMEPFGIALALVNTAFVWICLAVLVGGRTRLASHLFVAGTLVLLSVAYLRWGLQMQLRYQASQLIPVLVCGLLLRRHALWAAIAWLVAIVLAGAWQDVSRHYFDRDAVRMAIESVLGCVFAFLVIGIVLDRAVTVLRSSLHIAVRRSNELARSRDRLEREIAEKERSQARLVHAQKMEAVGRLASGIAHDFNHLLSLILGYAQRGQRAAHLDDATRALDGVVSATRRASATSRKLLSFSRQEQAQVEVFDAIQALREMQPMLRQLFAPSVKLALELDPGPAPVRFDRSQFELIVLNLAANANQAMADGGRFVLSACVDGGERLRLRFTDTGHGVPEDVRPRIFEPFFTTRPKGLGVGLGLSVAADLIREHGGDLLLERTSPGGSTFLIELPTVAAPA